MRRPTPSRSSANRAVALFFCLTQPAPQAGTGPACVSRRLPRARGRRPPGTALRRRGSGRGPEASAPRAGGSRGGRRSRARRARRRAARRPAACARAPAAPPSCSSHYATARGTGRRGCRPCSGSRRASARMSSRGWERAGLRKHRFRQPQHPLRLYGGGRGARQLRASARQKRAALSGLERTANGP